MSAARPSVFTFESVVHSSHVLRRLDEQRRRDTLCDVTVVVEGRGFRAHRSVLASCSDYFAQRISSLTQHGAVVTLPQEVTAVGFEPLLKFAYTCKLHFDKDSVLDIRSAASVLGFRDLDEACFDFLLPKFFSASRGSTPLVRKTCCESKCRRRFSRENGDADSDREVKPAAESSPQQEVALDRHEPVSSKVRDGDGAAPAVEGTKFLQCPKYRKFQRACGKEAWAPEKSLSGPAGSGVREDGVLSCFSPCSSTNGVKERPLDSPGDSATCAGAGTFKQEGLDKNGERDDSVGDNDATKMEGSMEPISGERGASARRRCPLSAAGSQMLATDVKTHNRGRGPGAPELNMQVENEDVNAEHGGEQGPTGDLDRGAALTDDTGTTSPAGQEVAPHCDSQPGPDEGPSQFDGPEGGRPADAGVGCAQSPPSEQRQNLGLTAGSCPFFEDGECPWRPSGMSECEGASQSGVSSVNSGEDGDSETETEGDSESSTRERARQVQLPFPVDRIVTLNRNDFQTLLKRHAFTQEQLDFVHDMRRRSKNRLAAQRCRKRKLDCIYNLQCEINKLKTEREKLIMERSQLSQLKLNTCHSVTALCQRVCSEANLQAEQLQVLARYTSSDCPLSSFLPHMDALLSQRRLHPQASLLDPTGGPDESEEETSGSGRDKVTGQHLL